MRLRVASPADIQAIMALERMPGFEALVGRWSDGEHAAEMAKDSALYLVAEENEGVVGFAMIQGLGDPHRKAHLRRIAVARPGEGLGTRLLNAVLDWLYANTDVNRIDLDVHVANGRARRSYEKAGFALEGRLRDFHRNGDGSYGDMWLMSILRADWGRRHRL